MFFSEKKIKESDLKKLEKESEFIKKAIEVAKEKEQIETEKRKLEVELNRIKAEKKVISVKPEIMTDKPIENFKKPERGFLGLFKKDKTNPIVMVIFSPAGDLTIRERVVDKDSNLSLGKNTLYRVEHTEIWDIADSDIKGFSGKKVIFYFQDIANPVRIRRDDKDSPVVITTENYAKSQRSHLLGELLAPEIAFKDYITMVLIGANLLVTIFIVFKLFFAGGS